MNPVSARLPVSAISRSRPIRSSISAHSAPVRWSFQRIAGRIDVAAGIERDEAVHLAGEPDPRDLARRPELGPNRGEHRARRAPPVLGILLRPAGARRRERIAVLGDGGDVPSGSTATAFTPVVPTSSPTTTSALTPPPRDRAPREASRRRPRDRPRARAAGPRARSRARRRSRPIATSRRARARRRRDARRRRSGRSSFARRGGRRESSRARRSSASSSSLEARCPWRGRGRSRLPSARTQASGSIPCQNRWEGSKLTPIASPALSRSRSIDSVL